MERADWTANKRGPGGQDELVGQKALFGLNEICAIRVRQLANRLGELAPFNLGTDSKWRAGDLIKLRMQNASIGGAIAPRAIVRQRKTQRPMQFEIAESTGEAAAAWIAATGLTLEDPLSSNRIRESARMSTRHCACVADLPVERSGSTGYALTRCGAPERGWPTAERGTFERYSCCSGEPRWRAPFDISGSR
jgi:hypothetical protein